MIRRISGIALVIVLLGIIVLAAGCSGTVKIKDIYANPGQYEGEEVGIRGTVSETFWIGLLSTGAYQVDDGSGTIWVITNKTPPDKKEKTSIKGTVSTSIKLGDRSFGTVITETKRN